MASFEITKKISKVRLGELAPAVEQTPVIITDVPLPDDAPARVKTLRAEGKKWYVTVTYLPNSEQPFALFCHTNNKEKTAQTDDAVERLIALARSSGILEEHILSLEEKMQHDTNVSKLTRSISLLLRHHVPILNIVRTLDQMESIFVGSFLFQIKKFLSQYIKDGQEVDGEKCTSCGGVLVFSEGCMMCSSCGNSRCG